MITLGDSDTREVQFHADDSAEEIKEAIRVLIEGVAVGGLGVEGQVSCWSHDCAVTDENFLTFLVSTFLP